MSLLKKFLVGVSVLVVVLVGVGLLLPSSVHVERSVSIDAPPHVVFALVNDFSNFNRWSPWAARDRDTAYTFEGPAAGVGARMTWASDDRQVGSGSQEITLSEANRRVEARLDFGSQGTAESFFDLEATEAGTAVTWGFDTDFGLDLLGRYMGLMFDSWIGADYELGLASLKSLAEGLPSTDWTDLAIEVVELEPTTIAYTTGSMSWDVKEISRVLGEAYGAIGRFMSKHQLLSAGQPLTITTGPTDAEWRFEAGIPLAGVPNLEIEPDAPVQIREIAGGRTVRGISVGPYANLQSNWEKLMAFVAVHGYEQDGAAWEQYVSDPGDTPEEQLITHLNLPVR